jgi:hypothetical protein
MIAGVIILIAAAVIIVSVVRAFLRLLPAILATVVIWVVTSNTVWAVLVFGVVLVLSLVFWR